MLYGAQTRRAMDRYAISGWPVPARLIAAIAELLRDASSSSAIRSACEEIIAGRHAGEFPVDVFQDRDGAATVINVCEVIASLAREPVVLGSSARDIFTAAIRRSVARAIREELRLEMPEGTFPETSAALVQRAGELPEECRQVRHWIAGADLTIQLCDREGDLPVLGVLLLESVVLLAAAIRGKN